LRRRQFVVTYWQELMMHRKLASLTIISLFCLTQFISMFYGLQLIAGPSAYDNIDDISLEDIVPLDPFLSTNSLNLSQTLPLSGNDLTPLVVQHDWATDIDCSSGVIEETARCERNPHLSVRRNKGLWLAYRSLLI